MFTSAPVSFDHWLLTLQVLLLVFAPAGIGGAFLGAVVTPAGRLGVRMAAACAGWVASAVVAYTVTVLTFGVYRGVATSDDLLWVSIAVGTLLSLAAFAIVLTRRRRPAREVAGDRPHSSR